MAILDSTIIKGDLKVLGKIKEHGNSGVNFSTAEQIYGTWIDGKMVYWRTFIAQNLSLSVGTTTILTNTGINAPNVIKVEGMVYNSSNSWDLNGFHSSQELGVKMDSGNILIQCGNEGWNNVNIRMSVYYFKD